MPRSLKTAGWSQFMFTASIGLADQVTRRLNSPAAAMLARPMTIRLTVSHRVRVMPWLHASRWVPASSSRVSSGAPRRCR